MKILICDDNKIIIEQIKELLCTIMEQSTYNFEFMCFDNGDDIISQQLNVDIAFVDIEMPGANGLAVTKHLQTLNPNIIIFIVTSYQGYLDEAMDLKVFRFLSKPIDKDRFKKSMEIALNLYHQNTERIVIDSFNEHHSIFTSDILYLNIDNRKTKIYTTHGEYRLNQKFDYWKIRLKQYDYFVQPHYSFIVNLKNVTDFNMKEITLSNGDKKIIIPISRSCYPAFKKSFYDYMGGTI